ncbi:MAG: 50S ribosomal protein L19 [Patescibacteria group bacterium]
MIDEKILTRVKPGATVRVFEKVIEGDKSRTSQFEGLVLARKHGSEPGASFTVRATVAGVGVEKVFPIHSTLIEKVEILSSPRKVSRAKLYYIRGLSRKGVRQKIGMAQTNSLKGGKDSATEVAP